MLTPSDQSRFANTPRTETTTSSESLALSNSISAVARPASSLASFRNDFALSMNSAANALEFVQSASADYSKAGKPTSLNPALTGNSSPGQTGLNYLANQNKCSQLVQEAWYRAGHTNLPTNVMKDGSAHYYNVDQIIRDDKHYEKITDLKQLRPGDAIAIDYKGVKGDGGGHIEMVTSATVNASSNTAVRVETAGAHVNGASVTDQAQLLNSATYNPQTKAWETTYNDPDKKYTGPVAIYIVRPRGNTTTASPQSSGAVAEEMQASVPPAAAGAAGASNAATDTTSSQAATAQPSQLARAIETSSTPGFSMLRPSSPRTSVSGTSIGGSQSTLQFERQSPDELLTLEPAHQSSLNSLSRGSFLNLEPALPGFVVQTPEACTTEKPATDQLALRNTPDRTEKPALSAMESANNYMSLGPGLDKQFVMMPQKKND